MQYIKLAEHIVYRAPEGVRAPRLQIEGAEQTRVDAIISKNIADLQRLG